jgi:T-complex protein 1 subunit delta
VPGGGAPEIECAMRLADFAKTCTGAEAYCIRAYAEALEVSGLLVPFPAMSVVHPYTCCVAQVIPFTLAENAGLNPISTVTALRARHKEGETTAGINVRKVWSPHLATLTTCSGANVGV